MTAGEDIRQTTAYTRELGDEVRDVRERSGMTLSKLVEGLGWPVSRLANVEAGRRGGTVIDLVRLVGYCQADQEAFDRVLDIANEEHLVRAHPDGLRALVASERKATEIVEYESMLIPGLLQTPEYARAIMLGSGDPLETVEPGVQTLLERQELLRESMPPKAAFFIHEASLHAWVGDRQVMADQMLQLALWGAWQHVSVRLVPFAVGNRRWLADSFRLMRFADGAEVVEKDRAAVERIDQVALDAQESRSEFARWAEHYERPRVR